MRSSTPTRFFALVESVVREKVIAGIFDAEKRQAIEDELSWPESVDERRVEEEYEATERALGQMGVTIDWEAAARARAEQLERMQQEAETSGND